MTVLVPWYAPNLWTTVVDVLPEYPEWAVVECLAILSM